MRRYSSQGHLTGALEKCLVAAPRKTPRRRPDAAPWRLRDRLTEQDRQDIATAYTTGGASLQVLAAKYSIGASSVRRVLCASGVPVRYRTVTPEQRSMIADLHAAGTPVQAIAQQAGVSPTTVRLEIAMAEPDAPTQLPA